VLPATDTVYTLSVVAQNFLGQTSNIALFPILKRTVPPPILAITIPAGPIYSQNTFVVEASAIFSKCVVTKVELSFHWTVATTADFANTSTVPGLNSTLAKLTIPAGSLQPGRRYYLRVVAVLPGSGQSTESRALDITQSPLVAKVTGGDVRLASITKPLALDASFSYDPDYCEPALPGEQQEPCDDPSLSFSWVCTVPATNSVCRYAADETLLLLGNQETATLDFPSLPQTLTSVVVTMTVFKGSRSSSHSVTINLSSQPVVQASIDVRKATPERLLLAAEDVAETTRCGWVLAGGDLPSDLDYSSAPYNDPSFVSTGWQATTLSMSFMGTSASKVLVPGTTYTVTLSCTTSEGFLSQVAHSWRMWQAPWGGTCTTSPKAGIAMNDTFTTICSTWSAEELPIQFSFGAGLIPAGASRAPEISYTIASFASVGALKLQQGNYTNVVRVYDAAGAWSTSEEETISVVAAQPGPGQTDEDIVQASITDMNSLAQSSGMMTASDSIMDSAGGDACEGDCPSPSPSSGRRLLASSAAYRMRVRR
jgi:hypothetical protein